MDLGTSPLNPTYRDYFNGERHTECAYYLSVGYPIDAFDGESPLVPLGTDERGIPNGHPRRGGV